MGDPVTTDDLDDAEDAVVQTLAEVLTQPGTATGGALGARALIDGSNLSVVPASATDVPARNLLDALGDLRSLKTYCTGDGASDDQAGLVTAFAAPRTNGWELGGANGIYVSTDTIPNFLDVKVSGRGAINRNGAIFHFNPLPGQRNTLYASPAGGGDGLSAAQPCRFAEALNALLVRGPVLSGLWRIRLAAGRYSPVSLDSRVRSVYPVEIRGPDVGGWPNEPTAVIDGAGMTKGRGIALSTGHSVYLYDIKLQHCGDYTPYKLPAMTVDEIVIRGGSRRWERLSAGVKQQIDCRPRNRKARRAPKDHDLTSAVCL